MELSVAHAQLIYDELHFSYRNVPDHPIGKALAGLKEAIDNVKETGDEYDLTFTLVPDDEEMRSREGAREDDSGTF